MVRHVFACILLTLLIHSCSGPPIINNSPAFKSFEISYTDGWIKGFSFLADSNKIYFSPRRFDTTYYGILPDAIFKMLDTAFLRIRNNQAVKSKDEGCVDCSVLAIKIISSSDTIRINQTGYLDKIFNPLIKTLQKFIDSSKHQSIRSVLWLDTKSIVTSSPHKINETKFNPPIMRNKSGR
jgi:hypothetical protein